MNTEQEIIDRVNDGVDWLNKQDANIGALKPWFTFIDLDQLNMSNACNCVLGQTAHHILQNDELGTMSPGFWFIVAVAEVGGELLNEDEAVELGFQPPRTSEDAAMSEFAELERQWRIVISDLQANYDECKTIVKEAK